MYDEAVKARFRAYCRAHPAWFGEGFLGVMAGLADFDLACPAQLAWRIMLDRYAGEHDGVGVDGEDILAGPIGWKAAD
jgi:hypothetical protein